MYRQRRTAVFKQRAGTTCPHRGPPRRRDGQARRDTGKHLELIDRKINVYRSRRRRPAQHPTAERGPLSYRHVRPAGPASRRIRRLAGQFRDTLRHSTRRAHGHVRLAQPPGQNGAPIAYAPVIGVCRAARAVTCTPVPGKRRAPSLHRGADGRIELVHRLGGRCRYPLPPLSQRGRSRLPGAGELPCRVVCVTGHSRIFSSSGGCGHPADRNPGRWGLNTNVAPVSERGTSGSPVAGKRARTAPITCITGPPQYPSQRRFGCSAPPTCRPSGAGGGPRDHATGPAPGSRWAPRSRGGSLRVPEQQRQASRRIARLSTCVIGAMFEQTQRQPFLLGPSWCEPGTNRPITAAHCIGAREGR